MKQARFYLASQSQRRKDLLKQWGYEYGILSDPSMTVTDETPHSGEDPFAYVVRVSREKALNAYAFVKQFRLPALPILTADTTVYLNGMILRKPVDEDDAFEILQKLSGQTHTVTTAVTLVDSNGQLFDNQSVSSVRFKALSAKEIRRYIATGEPMDKAGAYGIQGKAALFVESISGSYSGIVGLPAFETGQLLHKVNIEPD